MAASRETHNSPVTGLAMKPIFYGLILIVNLMGSGVN